MKKSIVFGIVSLFLFTMLVGCCNIGNSISEEPLAHSESSNLDDSQVSPAPIGVTMSISSYTANGLSYFIENTTDRVYTYGAAFTLYKFANNTWELVEPTIDGYWAFPSIGFDISPNSITEENIVDWVWLFGELPSGDYRFQKDILFIRQPGDFDRYVLVNYFTLP